MNLDDDAFPQRKRLPHDVPAWVPDGATCFVTINCRPREANQLAEPQAAHALRSSFAHQVRQEKWHLDLVLLMPDHLHALMSCVTGGALKPSITAWKRYISRTLGIRWQRDFFEHRIRDGRSYTEKWEYIVNNPIRRGLVVAPEEWRYVWTHDELEDPNLPSNRG